MFQAWLSNTICTHSFHKSYHMNHVCANFHPWDFFFCEQQFFCVSRDEEKKRCPLQYLINFLFFFIENCRSLKVAQEKTALTMLCGMWRWYWKLLRHNEKWKSRACFSRLIIASVVPDRFENAQCWGGRSVLQKLFHNVLGPPQAGCWPVPKPKGVSVCGENLQFI